MNRSTLAESVQAAVRRMERRSGSICSSLLRLNTSAISGITEAIRCRYRHPTVGQFIACRSVYNPLGQEGGFCSAWSRGNTIAVAAIR